MGMRAIFIGVTVFCLITLVLLGLGVMFGLEAVTGPRLLTLSALWSLAGYTASRLAGDAGILHGILSNLVGILVAMLSVWLINDLGSSALIEHLVAKPALQYLILAAFWGACGGMIADIQRAMRLKRARRRGQGASHNP